MSGQSAYDHAIAFLTSESAWATALLLGFCHRVSLSLPQVMHLAKFQCQVHLLSHARMPSMRSCPSVSEITGFPRNHHYLSRTLITRFDSSIPDHKELSSVLGECNAMFFKL